MLFWCLFSRVIARYRIYTLYCSFIVFYPCISFRPLHSFAELRRYSQTVKQSPILAATRVRMRYKKSLPALQHFSKDCKFFIDSL